MFDRAAKQSEGTKSDRAKNETRAPEQQRAPRGPGASAANDSKAPGALGKLAGRIGSLLNAVLLRPASNSRAAAPNQETQANAQTEDETRTQFSSELRAMGVRFGVSFDDVRLRTGADAAEITAPNKALAYTDGRDVGFAPGAFAPGAFAPETSTGRLRLAHELAHVVQMRGGNAGNTLPPLRSVATAEWQAQRAAAVSVAGGKPRLSAFPSGGLLFDKGIETRELPLIAAENDEDALVAALTILDAEQDGPERRRAIAVLIDLAARPGPVQSRAVEYAKDLLSGENLPMTREPAGASSDSSDSERDSKGERESAEASVKAMNQSTGVPLRAEQARSLEPALGTGLTGVRVHTDAAANSAARLAGARAVTTGNDIYFAEEEFEPETAKGRRLLVHELTHVVQDRAATAWEAPRLSHPGEASESAAVEAEEAVVGIPEKSQMASGADTHAPAAPAIRPGVLHRVPASVADLEATAADSQRDEDERSAAVRELVKNGSNDALAALKRLVTGQNQTVVYTTTSTIASIAGGKPALWDIVLASASVNSWAAARSFYLWLRQADGAPAIAYFARKLSSKDEDEQRNASRTIVTLLIAFADEPEAKPFQAAFTNLRELARKRGYGTGGILGVESLVVRIMDLYQTLIYLMGELTTEISKTKPSEDLHQADDLASLKTLSTYFDSKIKELSARDKIPETELPALDQTAAELSRLVEACTVTVTRTHTLHQNAEVLRKFIGPDVESDEITALYEVRSRHIYALKHHPQAPPLPPAKFKDFPEPSFDTAWFEADYAFSRYDTVVAQVKWKRLLPRINKANELYDKGFEIRPGGGAFQDPFYQTMRRDFEDRRKRFDERFRPSGRGQLGGTQVVIVGAGAQALASTDNLDEAIGMEIEVSLHGFDAAIFTLYAMALKITDILVTTDIGSEGFRKGLISELDDIRTRLSDFWKKTQYKAFGDAAPGIEDQLKKITEKIEHQVKVDIAVNLLITLAAALISAGVGAIARIALLGDVIAGVRTAESAATIVYLVEAGAFTAAQLSGESIAHGTTPTLGQVATAAVENLAFFGAFKAVSKLTAGFSQAGKITAFVAVHAANLAVMTGVSALLARIETGKWPEDVGLFLLQSAASYVIVASVHSLVQSQITNPKLTEKIKTAATELEARNTTLLEDIRTSVANGTLSEADFNKIRDEKLDIAKRLTEIAKFAKDQGLMKADDADAIVDFLTQRAASDSKTTFALLLHLANVTGKVPKARALPAPDAVPGLVRVGESNVYRYDAGSPPGELPNLLKAYADDGNTVEGASGEIIRVTDPDGHTVLLLEPATSGVPLLMLPETTSGEDPGFLGRATGVTAADVPKVEATLKKVHRNALSTLQGEFSEATAITTISLLWQQRGKLTAGWNIDAVRGLATMLEVERGILVGNVRRLFLAFTGPELNALFLKYSRATKTKGLQPGINLLVASEWTPQRSQRLIDAYDKLRDARLDLPAGMDDLALLGLLKLMDDHPTTWIDELKKITPVENRLGDLQVRAQGIAAPPPTPALQEVVRRLSADVRPGLNPLHGTPEQVTQAIEQLASPAGGKFSDPDVRGRFVDVVDQFQRNMKRLQEGKDGFEENAKGGRAEILTVLDVLLSGGEVAQFGLVDGRLRVLVNPGLFPLGSRKILVKNAPAQLELQIDVLVRRVTGTGELLQTIEVTDADVGLPTAWEILDPNKTGAAEIDWNALDPKASGLHRKWQQIIKIYAASEFAAQLGQHWGTGPVQMPERVVRARSFTPAAERALQYLGFKTELVK